MGVDDTRINEKGKGDGEDTRDRALKWISEWRV